MVHIIFVALFNFILTLSFGTPVAEKQVSPSTRTTNAIEDRSAHINTNEFVDLAGSKEDFTLLAKFYGQRNNELAWFDKGKITKNGRELLQQLEDSKNEGLSGEFYNLPEIKSDVRDFNVTDDSFYARISKIDFLMTKAYFDYASDLAKGRVDPNELNVVWEVLPQQVNMIEHLEESLEKGNIKKSLNELKPDNEEYNSMLSALNQLYREKEAGGWPAPGDIPTLHPNDSVNEVVRLKKYLAATGDLANADSSYIYARLFDDRLTEAVIHFQRRHGLEADGVPGKNTLKEMNKPIDYRINQIKLNLDRIRRMPEKTGNRIIFVNVPDYSLEYFENDKLIQKMKVVVGKIEKYTPILKDTITYLVFNPTWNVPHSIATEEMLPRIKTDPTYLSRNNYMLLKGSYTSNEEIDPTKVNWSKITPSNFPYRIVQRPGSTNALGRIKFMLPNNHSIYLHDTPADYLFNRAERDFSHGCIRLEKPFQLAETILDGQMPTEKIREIQASGKTTSVVLDRPVPVYIIYRTAWVDESGLIQFRDDIYDFDQLSLPFFKAPSKNKMAQLQQ